MDVYTATEEAYKKGYEAGKRDAVKHGRWIPTYHTYYNRDGEYQIADEWHCSVCGIYSRNEHNYCPNCGAMMDLEVCG